VQGRPGAHRVPEQRGRADAVDRRGPAHRRPVHRERDHAEALQPLPADHRPVGPGHRVHHEHVQGAQDHQDQLPRQLLPQEFGVRSALRQPHSHPGTITK